ncbi:HAMP domain-containing sensor histidine kinase [Quadrisphaera sp. DSM 44207]|uniref:sensor histidine kinase n=1 Tax=Quadrisphaera sp. DSM 44207 TaxID=1881057 RepID=UPI00087EEADB|nr:HAMP domain-containing sensor histidine kinase [Quadrisphaera sp. DSM 44207]SDQ64670.1 two-component system, OmpR family, sensor kinase [Quadrisphaera sp. DSM 44207]
MRAALRPAARPLRPVLAPVLGPVLGPVATPVREHLHQLSLRARLVAVVTGLLVVALALTGVVTVLLLQRVLVAQVDEDLRAVVSDEGVLNAVVGASQRTGEDDYPSDYVSQVSDAEGRVLAASSPPNQHGPALRVEGMDLQDVVAREREPFTHEADGRAWRLVAVRVQLPGGADGSVVLARPLDAVHQSLREVAAWFVLVGILVVTACALLGAALVRRAFRPLREVEAVATAFGDGDTSRRVRGAPPGTEVGRLGGAVNAMLDRIETSLAAREASETRMRRFVADASHELRTPLATVRGFAELHRQGAVREPEDVTAAFRRIETEAVRMGGLVEDLLLLARLDEQRPLRSDPVDLLVLAADAQHDARALAPDRTVALVGLSDGAGPAGPPAPATVRGDEARLRQVLANLLANALRHTPAGTPVEIGVGARDGWGVWQVVDHGPGIPPEDAERVFERFFRADTSRARGGGGGAGLGLAIVTAIVRAHSGAVRVVPTPGGGATVEVAIPAHPA